MERHYGMVVYWRSTSQRNWGTINSRAESTCCSRENSPQIWKISLYLATRPEETKIFRWGAIEGEEGWEDGEYYDKEEIWPVSLLQKPKFWSLSSKRGHSDFAMECMLWKTWKLLLGEPTNCVLWRANPCAFDYSYICTFSLLLLGVVQLANFQQPWRCQFLWALC